MTLATRHQALLAYHIDEIDTATEPDRMPPEVAKEFLEQLRDDIQHRIEVLAEEALNREPK